MPRRLRFSEKGSPAAFLPALVGLTFFVAGCEGYRSSNDPSGRLVALFFCALGALLMSVAALAWGLALALGSLEVEVEEASQQFP